MNRPAGARGACRIGKDAARPYGLTLVRKVCFPFFNSIMTAALIGLCCPSNLTGPDTPTKPSSFSRAAVTGFDDNIYARLSRPMLTTVRQKPEEKGKEAVGLLMRRIYGEEVPVGRMRLPTELIVRESVRNLADR